MTSTSTDVCKIDNSHEWIFVSFCSNDRSSFCDYMYVFLVVYDISWKLDLTKHKFTIECDQICHTLMSFTGRGSYVDSVAYACPLRTQAFSTSTLACGTFFHGKRFPSSADSRREICQFLFQELTLNTGKLPTGGLPRNNEVKKLTVPT